MTWKEAFLEVKKDSDLVLPDGSYVELLYPALIMCVGSMILLIIFG